MNSEDPSLPLTPAMTEALSLHIAGLSNVAIARRMGVNRARACDLVRVARFRAPLADRVSLVEAENRALRDTLRQLRREVVSLRAEVERSKRLDRRRVDGGLGRKRALREVA